MKSFKLYTTLLLSALSTSIFSQAKGLAPTVEDTIRYQLGGKLYFKNYFEKKITTPLQDSISIITADHYTYADKKYVIYKFIIHNKDSEFHSKFKPESLGKSYKSYFEPNSDMPYRYSEEYKTYYESSIRSLKDTLVNIEVNIDSSIKNYIGYWIYLTKHNDEFYIDDRWSWLPSFHLSNSMQTDHYMDGLYPALITFFKKETSGDFLIQTIMENKPSLYKIIDKDLEIYQHAGYFVVPAKNANKFKTIEYANNTGDLIG